jgi:hypothetical protein
MGRNGWKASTDSAKPDSGTDVMGRERKRLHKSVELLIARTMLGSEEMSFS